MMKICVIGNSHIGALIRAWDQIKEEYADTEITYFGAPSTTLSELTIEDQCLAPVSKRVAKCLLFTSGGYDRITPASYDTFLIYGCELNLLLLNTPIFYSKSLIKAAFEDNFKSTLSYDLLIKLRNFTDTKIYIGHNPLKARPGPVSVEPCQTYIDSINTANLLIYKSYNSELIAQPIKTIVNRFFTHPDYSKGSKKLLSSQTREAFHKEEDVGHMNDDFGKIWLRSFIERVVVQSVF